MGGRKSRELWKGRTEDRVFDTKYQNYSCTVA